MINWARVRILASPLLRATLGKLLTHTCLCHQAVQFGIGKWAIMPCSWEDNHRQPLESHWPHITDISGSPPTGSGPWRGRWAPTYALLVEYGELYLLLCIRTCLKFNTKFRAKANTVTDRSDIHEAMVRRDAGRLVQESNSVRHVKMTPDHILTGHWWIKHGCNTL